MNKLGNFLFNTCYHLGSFYNETQNVGELFNNENSARLKNSVVWAT